MGKSLTEVRFYDEHGERYLKNGKVRCQAMSKTRWREYKEENPEADRTDPEVFRELQCTNAAIADKLLCKYHGGLSDDVPRFNIIHYMPLDLQDIYRAVQDSPELLSRYQEISLMQARTVQLLESLQDGPLTETSYDVISRGLREIDRGDIQSGMETIRSALDKNKNEREVWDEIRQNTKEIDKLHRTQFTTEKELQTMSTREQVLNLITRLSEGIIHAIQIEVKDKDTQIRLYERISTVFRDSTGTGTKPVFQAIPHSSSED